MGTFIVRNIKRIIQLILGIVFTIVGIVGIFLPVIPGTIFLVFGMGLFVRTLPFLSLFFRLPGINEKMSKRIKMRSKILIILSLWFPYLILTFSTLYLRYNFSFFEFFSNKFELFSFLIPVIFLFLLSIYVLRLRSLAQVFGVDQKR